MAANVVIDSHKQSYTLPSQNGIANRLLIPYSDFVFLGPSAEILTPPPPDPHTRAGGHGPYLEGLAVGPDVGRGPVGQALDLHGVLVVGGVWGSGCGPVVEETVQLQQLSLGEGRLHTHSAGWGTRDSRERWGVLPPHAARIITCPSTLSGINYSSLYFSAYKKVT